LVARLTPRIPPQGAPRLGWSGASGAAAPLPTPWPPGRPAHQHFTGLGRRPAALRIPAIVNTSIGIVITSIGDRDRSVATLGG